MWECLLAAFLLPLLFVNGGHPGGTGKRHSTLTFQKTSWERENYDLQDGFFESLGSRVVDATKEKETDEQLRLWPLRMARSTEELLSVCDCLGRRSAPPSVCNFDIEEFGPVIINGTCFSGTRRRRRQLEQGEDDLIFASPAFPDLPSCEGTRPLLLVSTGEKRNLRLSNVPSVWMCPLSLGAPLQELVITNVSEVKMAPWLLAHRLADFTLKLSGMAEELVFPTGALSVDVVEVKNIDDAARNHMENIFEHGHPPKVTVIIENASSVKFETRSVSAPRVWVQVRLTEKLTMGTQAVVALSPFLTDSALHISLTRTLYMVTLAAIVNSLWVTNTSTVLLMEESVVVTAPEGEVILRHVGDIVAPERAIILGEGANLELSYVSFTSDSHRALLSQSPLRSVMLRGVEVVASNSSAVCLTTISLSLRDVTAALSEHSPASACLMFVRRTEVDTTEESGVVLCQVNSMEEMVDPRLCVDPRCKSCRDHEISTQPPLRRPTSTHVNETVPNEEAEGSWWEDPNYLILAAALAILVLLVLLSYCLYRLHRRSKRATYELPQTYRNGTFPRTIVTPDNLNTLPPNQRPCAALSNGASSELFVSYRVSHGPSLQQAALADQHSRVIGRSPAGPETTWRESHQPGTCQHHSSLMTPEDSYSISSSEMTI